MKVRELLDLLMAVQDPDNAEIFAAGFDDDEVFDLQAIESVLTRPDGSTTRVIVLEPTEGDPVGTHDPYAVDDE